MRILGSRDSYFVNLTIYGVQDVTNEQPLTFRIYDAAQGVVLGNVTARVDDKPLNLIYRPNDLIGTYDRPVVWTTSNEIEQQLNLKTGWNWISFYTDIDEDRSDLESVFGHSKTFNTIKGKEGFAMNNGTKWTSSGLETVSVGTLYKVKMKTDMTHSVSGSMIDTRMTSQTIFPGWNWIGPLSIYNMSVAEAFADLTPTRGDIVKSKNQVAIYDGYKWEGTLTAILPGVGYYYKSNGTEEVSFHYPIINGSYSDRPLYAARHDISPSPFKPVDHHQFSDNMNVVARVMAENEQVDTLVVAAFIGDECRGVTRATSDGLYMLTIAGNADETNSPVKFATVVDGDIVWLKEQLVWLSDYIYGDLDNPQLLTLPVLGINEITYNDGIVITPTIVIDNIVVKSGSLLKDVNIYNVYGAKVLEKNQIGDNLATIDASRLDVGVYFVVATTVNGYHVTKRILKR